MQAGRLSRLLWKCNHLSSSCAALMATNVKFHTSPISSAGHSKWANIRHIKAAKDGQRAQVFARLTRQIRMAVQEGGSSNPQLNSLLRNVVDMAIKKNMPMSTIQAAIKRSDSAKAQFKKHVLDIKLMNTPIYLACVLYTDNVAGFKMQMAAVLKKSGATLTDARHLFESRGVINAVLEDKTKIASAKNHQIDELLMTDAIECGAEDVEVSDDGENSGNFICDPSALERISRELVSRGYRIESSEHMFLPKQPVNVSESDEQLCDSLRAKLKALDGVDEIYDNYNV